MSEFTLPANSKVGKGKHWPAPNDGVRVKSFRIYRWDPAKNANPSENRSSTAPSIAPSVAPSAS